MQPGASGATEEEKKKTKGEEEEEEEDDDKRNSSLPNAGTLLHYFWTLCPRFFPCLVLIALPSIIVHKYSSDTRISLK